MPFVLWISVALGAAFPAPTQREAAAFVEEVVDVVADGRVSGLWAARTFVPWPIEDATPSVRLAWAGQVDTRLAPGGDWRAVLARRPRVAATVSGPDYTRVVLQDTGWTLVVRRMEDGLVVDRVEASACDECAEPERFVTDLFNQIDTRDAAGRRLLPGGELAVQPWLDDEGPADKQRWSWALQNRNARAGYLWWLLRDAEVLATVDDDTVQVQLETGVEDWSVVYRDRHWQLDYAQLPEDSALRLPDDQIAHWTSSGRVRQETLTYWRPTWEPQGDTVRVDDMAMFVAPRALQGDVVLYHQDMGSRWAMIATLDPETGEVQSAVPAPRVPMSFFLPTSGWWDWLEIALSPDGRHLAVGVQTRLWVIAVDTGDVVLAATRLPRITALSWSPDGKHLAAGDIYGGNSLYRGPSFQRTAQARSSGRPIHGHAWLSDGVLAVDEAGAVHRYRLPDLVAEGVVDKACCGGVHGVERLPFTGEVVIGCAGTCAPAWLWRWDPVGSTAPEVLADARLDASSGFVSADPTGRWLVVGHSGDGGAMALWDLREGRIAATFSDLPLRQVSWSPEGGRIWGIDLAGRSWRWDVALLVAGG
jgi:hypothetical protein